MRTHWLSLAAASCVVALGLAACGSDASNGGSGGGTSISIWEGWTGAEAKTFTHLVGVYQKQNPGTTISSLYVNNDNTLQKVLTAVRGGSPPASSGKPHRSVTTLRVNSTLPAPMNATLTTTAVSHFVQLRARLRMQNL